MFEIKGLDKLTKELNAAQTALKELDGTIGSVRFDSHDPASIETAIVSVENMIDEKIAGYENNQIVASIAAQMKEEYREGIIERAAADRLKANSNDE